jgi:hypothetical protein
MKNLIIATLVLFTTQTFASDFIRPVGEFAYTKVIKLNKKRTAETVSHETAPGQERIRDLKKTGFICVRKNQKVSICQKTENNFDAIPLFLQKAADDFLANAHFIFPGDGEPQMVHDGSDTEWLIHEDVMIGKNKVTAFKVVRKKDNKWYVSLPVSDEQGIGVLELYSEKEIALPLTVERKEDGQTVGYFFTANFSAE